MFELSKFYFSFYCIFLTNVDGVYKDWKSENKELINTISISKIENKDEFINDLSSHKKNVNNWIDVTGSMKNKLEIAFDIVDFDKSKKVYIMNAKSQEVTKIINNKKMNTGTLIEF